MLPYAAYLRVYEPLSAFSEADRERWAVYANSQDRPRRARALMAEQSEALGRLIALPPIAAPVYESEHAYIRWADGVTYVCPWQTRLRSWLALTRLRATSAPLLAAAFVPGDVQRASREFARWQGQVSSLRVFVQACTWSVPTVWFAPFAPEERWLVLGTAAEPEARGPATASATRTLIYATAMPQARRRVARALAAVRHAQAAGLAAQPAGSGRPRLTRSSPRSGAGWRSSIPIPSWNSIMAVLSTCSTMRRSGPTSLSPRCPPPSRRSTMGSRNWPRPCTSGFVPGGRPWRRSNSPTE